VDFKLNSLSDDVVCVAPCFIMFLHLILSMAVFTPAYHVNIASTEFLSRILMWSGRSGNGGRRPPISTKEPTFLNRAKVGHARSANHAPRAPQVSRKCPAWSRKVPQGPAKSSIVQHSPAKSRRCPANSRNVPLLDVRDHAGPSTSIVD
jgi:hypothetical protein